jgi:hypothetical protein
MAAAAVSLGSKLGRETGCTWEWRGTTLRASEPSTDARIDAFWQGLAKVEAEENIAWHIVRRPESDEIKVSFCDKPRNLPSLAQAQATRKQLAVILPTGKPLLVLSGPSQAS